VGPRPIATTEVPKRSPSSGKPTNRFYPAMSSGRCPVPPVGEDGGLLRTRFTSALLPRACLRQAVLDLPSLRPGTALLQPAVPPTSLSTTAAPRQPPPSAKSRIVVSLYLTLFDNPQTACVPFGDRSVRVQRVRVCSASAGANRQSYFLICSSAFRFPPVLVSYHFIESAKETVQDVGSSTEPRRAISYSPFPAELGTSPVSQDFTFSTATVPLSEAEVDTVGPLAHIRQNLEIDNLRLSDFEVRAAAVSPYQVGLGKTVSALTSTDAPGRSRSTRWVSTPPPFRYPYFSRTRFKEIFAVSFPPSPPRLTCL